MSGATDPDGRHVDRATDQDTDQDMHQAVDQDDLTTTRHEERITTGTELHESGRVRVRKHVETHPVEEAVTRSVEHADDTERHPALEGDSGEVETLEDGSVSIPVFEEVLVVTKKLVVRERVVVRKHTVVDEHVLRTELRREHVSVEADDPALLDDRRGGSAEVVDPPG